MANLNFEQELDFNYAFKDEENKVRDHYHLTELYRGPSHVSCNLTYKIPNLIPMVAHNLANFDNKYILQKLHDNVEGKIKKSKRSGDLAGQSLQSLYVS